MFHRKRRSRKSTLIQEMLRKLVFMRVRALLRATMSRHILFLSVHSTVPYVTCTVFELSGYKFLEEVCSKVSNSCKDNNRLDSGTINECLLLTHQRHVITVSPWCFDLCPVSCHTKKEDQGSVPGSTQ